MNRNFKNKHLQTIIKFEGVFMMKINILKKLIDKKRGFQHGKDNKRTNI